MRWLMKFLPLFACTCGSTTRCMFDICTPGFTTLQNRTLSHLCCTLCPENVSHIYLKLIMRLACCAELLAEALCLSTERVCLPCHPRQTVRCSTRVTVSTRLQSLQLLLCICCLPAGLVSAHSQPTYLQALITCSATYVCVQLEQHVHSRFIKQLHVLGPFPERHLAQLYRIHSFLGNDTHSLMSRNRYGDESVTRRLP